MRAALRLLAVALLAAAPAAADTLTFEGRVEAARQAELSSQLDGAVIDILFSGGEAVQSGQPMILLDPADAELAVAAAAAALAAAEADLDFARQESGRASSLNNRGIATPVQVQAAEAALRQAEARLALGRVDLARAELMLARTVIRAPIDGFAGAPEVAAGAFLEAESGSPLGRIVALDPVVIAYRVPYATRLATLAESGAPNLAALFERIEIAVILPDGTPYPHTATPDHASALVDPSDGTVTVRAQMANPDALLRPGMAVTVQSRIAAPETER